MILDYINNLSGVCIQNCALIHNSSLLNKMENELSDLWHQDLVEVLEAHLSFAKALQGRHVCDALSRRGYQGMRRTYIVVARCL